MLEIELEKEKYCYYVINVEDKEQTCLGEILIN